MLEKIKPLFGLEAFDCHEVPGHEGGRNRIYVCEQGGEKRFVLRVSDLGDRTAEEYLAETEFVHYLARNGAPAADVIPSLSGRYVESLEWNGKTLYISLFEYAAGMLISDNGYRYREGAPLEEYFRNTGKALGKIHRLSAGFAPVHRRMDYFDKYNMRYINGLIPDTYADLKQAIAERLSEFRTLPVNARDYGLVHFDFNDGNYHIDMNTGALTVFDFDNCMYCWYMFDLANLWTHGEGWVRFVQDPEKRRQGMNRYFSAVLEGYRSEYTVSEELLARLPLFIDMVLIENIVDEFECCAREGEEVDPEDIEDAVRCLIDRIPYGGII